MAYYKSYYHEWDIYPGLKHSFAISYVKWGDDINSEDMCNADIFDSDH